MSFPELSDVTKIMALVPVVESRALSREDYLERLCDVLRLIDIPARPFAGGIEFEGGLQQENQPLANAIANLVERRFANQQGSAAPRSGAQHL